MAAKGLPPIWTLSVRDALEALGSGIRGLAPEAVPERLRVFGQNRLPGVRRRSVWQRVAAQLKGFLTLVLVAAAVIAWAIGDLKDAVMILLVIVFNVVLGVAQEHRAERALSALRKMAPLHAHARRAGVVVETRAEEIVPGDVVLLEAGDRVPADGRLLVAHGLGIDESALTGESVAQDKQAESVVDAETSVAERSNMAFMNSVVTRGRGELVVSATGLATETGRVAQMLATAEEVPTPLQRQLDHLGKRLSVIAAVAVAVVSIFQLLHGKTLGQIALEAVALGVAAVPDGLPAVLTLALALGVHRMAMHRAIVKRLSAVETLGSTTTICSDKTGTLTLNQMTVRAVWVGGERYSVSGEGYAASGEIQSVSGGDDDGRNALEALMMPAALCNDSRIREGHLIGDPTEGALLALAMKAGVDDEALRAAFPRVSEIPFDASHKYMATFHRGGRTVRLFVKGAPEVVSTRSSSVTLGGQVAPLGPEVQHAIQAENARLADRGLRVLALATREIPDFDGARDPREYVSDLTLAGLVGIGDPPRPAARSAIALCSTAGIDVKMITGDQPMTARAIARDLGLSGEVLAGADMDRMDDRALASVLAGVSVFARVTPEHKLRLVRVAQASGQVVAMTGDGVNDAPALKTANIGVAMGSGTEVAKEAAAMVLTDDNFDTIVVAVEEGRAIYDNIVKFVRFQLSTNMGALLTVFFAPLVGLVTPLGTAQILWVAMIMDGPPALALGVDPARPTLMQEPPRPSSARILTLRRLSILVFHGVIMAAGTLGVLGHTLSRGDPRHGSTLAFTTFVMFQVMSVFNARSEKESIFHRETLFTNRRLWVAVLAVVCLQLGAVHFAPLQRLFGTTELSARDWGVAVAVAATVVVLEEVRKWARPRLARRKSSLTPPRTTA